jgi:exopolysaccharide biosynthesis polyprenyl glycosylphosphotransferase
MSGGPDHGALSRVSGGMPLDSPDRQVGSKEPAIEETLLRRREPGTADGEMRDPRDVRSTRPYVLTRHPMSAFARRVASIAALLTIDVSGLALGLYTALAIREIVIGEHRPLWGLLWEAEKAWLPFLTLLLTLVFWREGLYEPRERRGGFVRILYSVIIAGILALAFGIGAGHEFSTYGLVPTAVALTAGLIGLFRASYEIATAALLRARGIRRRALLVGRGAELAHVSRSLGSTAGIEYEFVGAATRAPNGLNVPRLGTLEELPRILAHYPVDEVIVADSRLPDERLLQIADQAQRQGVKVRVAPKTTQILAQRARYVPGQGIPLFELRAPIFEGFDWVLKRGFDLVVSTLLAVGGLPLWLLIALAVKLSSPGPVLYRDNRVGVGEREFPMLKFRTMYGDACERQGELEAANEADGALFKLKDDPRITRVGAFLRRFSLDEMPQIVNVLRGEMSLVGPRPLPIRDYRLLEPWHRKRYLVLPGMTGLWQISGRSDLGFDDLVRLDFYYLENWSVWLDVSIILKTIPAVLRKRGAY